MGTPLAPGVALYHSPWQCELDFVRKMYRDNFGPRRIDRFEAEPTGSGALELSWTGTCHADSSYLRITAVDQFGAGRIVADSLPSNCAPATSGSYIDSSPSGGTYYLSEASNANGGRHEQLLAQVDWNTSESAFALAGRHQAYVDRRYLNRPATIYSTPHEVVQVYAHALTTRDRALLKSVASDGFSFTNQNGLVWGRHIEHILNTRVASCTGDLQPFAVEASFSSIAVEYPVPGLATAVAQMNVVNSCIGEDHVMSSQVRLALERDDNTGGWKLLQIVELTE